MGENQRPARHSPAPPCMSAASSYTVAIANRGLGRLQGGAGVCGMALWVRIRGEGLPMGRTSRGPRTGYARHHRREGERVNGGNTGLQTFCPGSNTVTIDCHLRHKTAACQTTRTVQGFVPNKTAKERFRASSSLRCILNIRGVQGIWCWDHETGGGERPARGAR